MARNFDQMPTREALAAIAHDFHGRGWMAGTAGNLSARSNEDKGCFWITSSGLPKGNLDADDLILIRSSDGEVQQRLRENARPSAETSIHQAIYSLFPSAQACFHVHTVDACLATARVDHRATEMRLPALEMIKGLDIWEETPQVSLALFDNMFDVPLIAHQIRKRFTHNPPQIPALMIRNHGITVWGSSLQQAYNRTEIIEFIMSYMARG
ncbi:MAG: methylthioribulose 1-phosphate dehydratase [Pseudomonadota bacterium]|nr:methylthioribulose 1-phosphate dehydratase [Pseudomonadota bacterium]